MAISAQRFSFLDQETNVAVTDFLSATNKGTLNSPGEDLAQTQSDSLLDFLGNYNTADGTPATKDSVGRIDVNDILTTIDPSGLTTKEQDEAIKRTTAIGTGTPLTGMFGQFGPTVTKDVIGQTTVNEDIPPFMSVGGEVVSAVTGYDVTAIGVALNKMTNGAYDFTSMDIGKTIDTIVGITTAGTKGGLPGVFSALLDQLSVVDQEVVTKSLYTILSGFIADDDTVGILNMVTQLNNVSMKLLIPDIGVNAGNSMTIPRDVKENELADFSAKMDAALAQFDDKFNSSSYDDIVSTNGIKNEALTKGRRASSNQLSFGPAIGELNDVNSDPNLVEHFFTDPFDNTKKSTFVDIRDATSGSSWNLMLGVTGQLPTQAVTTGSGYGPPLSSTAVPGDGFGPPEPRVIDKSNVFLSSQPQSSSSAITQSLGLF